MARSSAVAGGLLVVAVLLCGTAHAGDPLLWTETTLLSGLTAPREWGEAVAISGDTLLANGKTPDNGFAYVFVRHGVRWTLQARLSPRDGGQTFGDGVANALAIDGDTALVSRIGGYSGNDYTPGSVYVFVRRNGNEWVEQQKLLPDDGPRHTQFGEAVAIDGDTAVIGDEGDEDSGHGGAAYVFVRSGDVWTKQQKLLPTTGISSSFGWSVAIRGDRVLVGALGDADSAGAVYVYRREGEQWLEEPRLVSPSPAARTGFGVQLAFSGDTAAIADRDSVYLFARAPEGFRLQQRLQPADATAIDGVGIDGDALAFMWRANTGAPPRAFVYVRGAGGWTKQHEVVNTGFADTTRTRIGVSAGTIVYGAYRDGEVVDVIAETGSGLAVQQTLTARDGGRDERFGFAVGIDGAVAVVGAGGDQRTPVPAQVAASGAYAYLRDGSTWGPPIALLPGDASMADRYGEAVAIASGTVLVGAGSQSGGRGSVYVFEREGDSFAMQQKLVAQDGVAGHLFGDALALDADRAIVGAIGAGPASGAGAAYVFARSGDSFSQQQKLTANDAADGDLFGVAVAIDGDVAIVGASDANARGSDSGAAYVFARSGSSWTQTGKLIASDGATNHDFGAAVALSGDTALIGAPGPGSSGTRAGAAYVFVRDGSAWEERQRLTASDGAAADYFGGAVGLDGDIAAIGALGAADGGANAGAAYLFLREAGSFGEARVLRASDRRAEDEFGHAVAVGGRSIVVGAPFAKRLGGARVYDGFDAELDDGAACVAPAQCASGFCVEGLCCESACDSACESCVAARKQAGADGECGAALSGLPCGPEPLACASADAYALAPTCDADGACRERTAACSDGLSCVDDAASGQCLPACDDDGMCPEPMGAACDENADCASGLCEQGVCGGTTGDDCDANSCPDGTCEDGVCVRDCGADCPEPTDGGTRPDAGAAAGAGGRDGTSRGGSGAESGGTGQSGGADAGDPARGGEGDDGCGCRVPRSSGQHGRAWLLPLIALIARRLGRGSRERAR